MKKISVSALCRTGVIAAIYFCISVVFAPISFGAVQVRVSEALTILPTLSPLGIYGVTIGCLLTNIYGISTGANILGAADVFFGTMATFVSALLTYKLRNVNFKGFPLLSTLPPIIINAAVVGAELSFALMGSAFDSFFLLAFLQVGAGQIVSCCILGFFLYKAIIRAKINL